MRKVRGALTVAQVSALKGISENGVRIAIRAGRLPAEKVGGLVYLIRASDAEAWQPKRGWPKGKPRKPQE